MNVSFVREVAVNLATIQQHIQSIGNHLLSVDRHAISDRHHEKMARVSLSQFTKFMSNFSSVDNNNRENFSSTNVVPEFDPSLRNQTINNWVTKVNECAVLYGWTERQIVHNALPKLVGVAKKWYEGLPTLIFMERVASQTQVGISGGGKLWPDVD